MEIHIDEDRSAYNTPVAPGTIFESKYQVLEEIGRGGMGVVYKGHDLSLNRQVAIKVLPEQFNTDDDVIARFKKEARAMAALDHPNIVPVYAIGQQRNFHYFVMKFLDGGTVAERLEDLRRQGLPARVEQREVREVLAQVCKGLGHAHRRGLIHRDIKPGNIMLSPEGLVTIMDFGIVKEQMGGESLTRTGLVFGTPEYMAPEQAQGEAEPGPSTDLYSLGIVGYEMLSGKPPYTGDTPFSIVLKHIKNPPPPLIDKLPDIDPSLQHVIFHALEKDPETRWATAGDMREALDAIPFDGSVAPPMPSPAPGLPAQSTPGARPVKLARPQPFIPVAPPPSEADAAPVLVDDRPGHYRQLLTARDRKAKERSRRNTLWIGVLVVAVGLTGLVLILMAQARQGDEPPKRPKKPPVVEPAPAAADAGPAAIPVESDTKVSVHIDSTPSGAEIFSGGVLIGTTPNLLIEPRGSKPKWYTLKRPGFEDKRLMIGFQSDRQLVIDLTKKSP